MYKQAQWKSQNESVSLIERVKLISKGTLFSNDGGVSHAKAVKCLYASYSIRHMSTTRLA